MAQPDLTIIDQEEVPHEELSLKSEKKKPVKRDYTIDQPELSKNIQKYDKIVKNKVYTQNPYSFNEVARKAAEKRKVSVPPVQTAEQMITDSTYNSIGKFLGVDTIHDWNKDYDKVFTIVEWAKAKSGTNNLYKLMQWISSKARTIPSVTDRKLYDLHLFAKLHFSK